MIYAVLIAVTIQNTLHIRPLCTGGDVLLALNELLDKRVFSYGIVQLAERYGSILTTHSCPYGRTVGIDKQIIRVQYKRNVKTRWFYAKYVYTSTI
jgi:hypothetical protein